MQNRAVYLQVIREVCEVLHVTLRRRPFKEEAICTAKRLAQEYPVLQCGIKESYGALYESLKKRINNSAANKARRKKRLERALTVTQQEEQDVDQEGAKDTVQAIRKMDGDTQQVLADFPELGNFHTFLKTLAILQKKTTYSILQSAVADWQALKRHVSPDESSTSAFGRLKSVLSCL